MDIVQAWKAKEENDNLESRIYEIEKEGNKS
jgi:hypothetical protein